MKKLLFVISILCASQILFSQIVVNPAEVIEVFELDNSLDQEIVGYSHMFNNQGSAVVYKWEKTILHNSPGWEIAFCDKNACYLPFVNSAEVTLDPGESGTSDVHLYTGKLGMPGDSCIVKMTIFEVDNPDNRFEGIYKFYTSPISPLNDIVEDENSLTLFPNPTSDHFNIMASFEIDKIYLLDFNGKIVRNYQPNDSKHSLAGLPSGIYFAEVRSLNGAIKKSVKLIKK